MSKYIKSKYIKIICLLLIGALTSCATIIHGTRQSVGVSSNPANAAVWVDKYFVGYTPLVVDMTRKDHHCLHIQLDGFQPYEAVLTRKVSGWVLGNIIFGGVIGLAVDAISGGLYRLTPDQIQADMCAQNICFSQGSDGIPDTYIAIVLNPDPSWTKIGTLVAK